MRNQKKEEIFEAWYNLLHSEPGKKHQRQAHLDSLLDRLRENTTFSRDQIKQYLEPEFKGYRAAQRRQHQARLQK